MKDGTIKENEIRWLALNGGIRWVSLNEREKAMNERGGKEDMRGKKHSGEGDFWREHYFSYWETVLEHFWGGD